MSGEIPLVNIPYPPELTIEEILSRRSDERLRSKAPNQFFIYRLAYLKELRKIMGENISMTKIAPEVGTSWSREPPEVKEAYKVLSERVKNRLKEMRQNDPLIIIHENFPSPPPPPPPTDNDDTVIFFYPYYLDHYYYDYDFYYYDYYSYYYIY
ncbi:hypothetical protein RclHR1_00610013 [Rhizophagus clarus]|uniref:Kinase-like domain-containing protein n=1 Tax=Rhizophagus clarus TaxID=94130 RepID=A0A2Z6RSH1_9GLOM|nr:hypothetical protein RclHR1_00610013 [Rhizophagus clarus]GES75969.1 kinase-like domain-containing protein [Rhizophagus clarus]